MSTEEKPPMKRINFEISEDTHTRLKVRAAKEKKSVKDFVTDLLEKALQDGQQDARALA